MKKMQNAKKILALFLIASMLFLGLMNIAGCNKRSEDDKGAVIPMYLAGDPSNLNLDPGKLIYSSEAVKFLGLIFEGLTVMDENGKLQKGMAKSWTISENEEKSEYIIEFELKDSKWSDGIPVSADDFVYAWKRILDPDFSSPAAPLLYSIKNARAVKEGDMTVDDLGVYALDTTTLQVTFDHKIDYDKFLENCASIALVPVRSDTVDFRPEDWAKTPANLLSNGPFTVKQMEYNKLTSLERSTYYLLPGKKGENIFKYVTPYKLSLDFSRNITQMTDAYLNASDNKDLVFYIGSVPVAKYSELESKADLKDMLSTYSYHFNTDVALFKKWEVRKALSIALDRNEIARIVGLGVKPATGIVPTGVIDVKASGDDFRKAGGDVIPAGGDMAGAKTLLQQAGVTGGSIELKVRSSERGDNADEAIAEYVKSVWAQLGFTVTIKPMKGVEYSNDIFEKNYDVIGYDDQAVGVDAFSVLAPFAKPLSGGKVEFQNEGVSIAEGYITGFQDDAYDALLEEILLLDNDIEARTQKLHEAEKKLIDLSPVAPLYFNTSINITDKLTGLSYSKFGFTIFTKANLKNYLDYTTTIEDTRETIVAQD
ncbi:MAG: peptide ABC transporter substrate-binding protein [Oscillospiraceae bacterium]|nr:peptide ABC transporter substrate-binding protein [Oscillospiraceae bacterium]